MDQQQTDGKKQKRELPAPEGDRVASVNFTQQERLEYAGRSYIKMSQIIKSYTLDSASSRRPMRLWLCIEAGGTFPARTVIVPEFVK